MKLKYIFTSLVAALGLMLTSCTEEADTFLAEVQVSSSYVAIPAAGGNVEITVNAQDAWTIEGAPDWLTISPLSGNAGEAKVKFSAGAAEDSREATVKLTCLGKTQNINVIQMTEKTELPITPIATVISTASGTFRVKGVVTKVANTQYGNFYMNDDSYTGSDFQIYGTKVDGAYPKDHPKGWAAFDIEVGDIITVEGPYSLYGSTHELVDVEIIAHEKSLIKVKATELLGGEEPVAGTEFPLEGGSIKVSLEVKGEGFHVIIPDAAKSWLHIEDFGSDFVVLKADANAGGDRSTEVTFTTEKDGKTYTCVQALSQKGAITPINIADFNALADGNALYRVKGVITSIVMDSKDNTKYNKYGNFHIVDETGDLYVYGLLDGPKGASAQDVLTTLGAKVGDVITVVGPKASYNNAPQMKNAYKEEYTAVTAKTCAEFNALADGSDLYLVSGTITDIVMDSKDNTKYNKYGNFHIKDASGESVYVYGLVPTMDSKSGQDILTKLGVKVGDIITVVGPKASYNNAPQMKNAFYVSHEEGPSGPSFAIDGNFDEWADVAAFAGINDRILEWKAASDASNVYFYYKITASKIKADGSSKIYIGFDLDNNATTGDQGEHGGTGTDNGSEALVFFYPWDGTTAVLSGEIADSWVKNPISGESIGKVTVAGSIADGFAYLEVSMPRAVLGTLKQGDTYTVRHAMQYYKTNREVVTLLN